MNELEQFVVTRLDNWTLAQWTEICDAVADVVVSVADTFEEEGE